MDPQIRAAKNEIFQTLKPVCIEVSQRALREGGNSPSLIEPTSRLLDLLLRDCQRTDGAFDEKLADYVYFPLSQLLRGRTVYTDRLTELVVKCLKVLLEHGWKNKLTMEVARPLLVLLPIIAGGLPGKEQASRPEELVMQSFDALSALFRDMGNNPTGMGSLLGQDTLPAIAHCASVILDAISTGTSAHIQIAAVQTLGALWSSIKDVNTLCSFLPGTISSLTRCLAPSTSSRRPRRTLLAALPVLQAVLTSLLSDIRTRNIRGDTHVRQAVSDTTQKTFTPSWLKATTAQVKLALANVLKLRTHDSADVREALNKLCLVLLDECHDTLAESSSILVETCMTLSESQEESHMQETTLADLATIHPDIGEAVKATFYNWATGLPRVMGINDEAKKKEAIGRLSKANRLIGDLNLGSSILDDTLAQALRDSVVVALDSSSPHSVRDATVALNNHALTTFTQDVILPRNFGPVFMPAESQKQTRNELLSLLSTLGTSESQLSMASEMLEYARGASGASRLAAYWIAHRTLKAAGARHEDLDEFLHSSVALDDDYVESSRELLSFSLSILSDSDFGELDWRMSAIALEVVAHSAQRLKVDFRTELVDSLYPVSQLLGSSHPELRERAIICLNLLSEACGYADTRELIVQNVDYMVNSISLRLNTFDISPQAPQVLVMMIRLTGPSLLPYLDDVVASIFAALDNFHGYQALVETLFSVLSEIVDVGSKQSSPLLVEPKLEDLAEREPAMVNIVQAIRKQQRTTEHAEPFSPHEDFPREPWKDAKTLMDEMSDPVENVEAAEDEASGEEIQKAPLTKSYTMVQTIIRLGQHYLTNQSALLRAKLLNLISTSCLSLHVESEAFLPLINDIWPVVIARLYDSEPFVVIAAADAVTCLCRTAQDFLSSRVSVEWSGLIKLARSLRAKMSAEKTGSGARGKYSQVAQLWESIVRLLVAILECVRIDEEAFDDVLELLLELVERDDVRTALEKVNADAVWLVLQSQEKRSAMKPPALQGCRFVAFESMVMT